MHLAIKILVALIIIAGVGIGVYFLVDKNSEFDVVTSSVPETTSFSTKFSTETILCPNHSYCEDCEILNSTEICNSCFDGYYQFGETDYCYKNCDREYNYPWLLTCEDYQTPLCKIETAFTIDLQTCLYKTFLIYLQFRTKGFAIGLSLKLFLFFIMG